MANKYKKVDIVSSSISIFEGNAPSFEALLNSIWEREFHIGGKLIEFSRLECDINNCIIGFVETMQDKDIPPIKNKETKVFSPVQINTATEGLAFANIFIYDTNRNVLIYEINRNGCYLNSVKEIIEAVWSEEHEDNPIEVHFPLILRRDEYARMLNMTSYRKIAIEIRNPSAMLQALQREEESLHKQLLKSQAESAVAGNSDYITIEQRCDPVHINRQGIQGGYIRGLVDSVNRTVRGDNNISVQKLQVQGYTIDPASEHLKGTTVDLLADKFNERFPIPEVRIQTSLQRPERKEGIISVYNRVLPEIDQIIASA